MAYMANRPRSLGDHVMLAATAAACRGMWQACLALLEEGGLLRTREF